MKGEPILIECEGSGGPGNLFNGMMHCRMCNRAWRLLGMDTRTIPDHQRDDLLARIERGDFDAS